MVLSSVQVLLEIEHGSVIKRWLSSALVPLGGKHEHPSKIDFSGEAIIAGSERKTRSTEHPFSSGSEVEGKVCVCETFSERSADEAVLFAQKVSARALLVAHEPDVAVTIPTIIISQEYFKYIEHRPAATISAVQFSGSYKGVNVTLNIQRVSLGTDQSLQWESKMFIPTGLIEKTISGMTFKMMIDTTPYIFRDARNNIVDSGDECFALSGKACLFDARYASDVDRVVKLTTECGASALFICCKEPPDWSGLTVPAIAISRDQVEDLKKAGINSRNLGVTISYKEVAISAENTKPPPSKREGRVDPTPSMPPQRYKPETGREPPGSNGSWVGGAKAWMAKAVNSGVKTVFGYSPKSKKEFDEIIRSGTSWSYDHPNYTSFDSAMLILDQVRRLRLPDERQAELTVLIKAIREMTERHDFVGDLSVILFCAHIFSLEKDLHYESTSELEKAMVIMVDGIIIDPNVPKVKSSNDMNKLDQCIVRLVSRISYQRTHKSNHVTFVVNALWIRRYHCDKLDNGIWADLRRVTSLKCIESQQETILSFMCQIKFNTLLITSIVQDLSDVCRIFHGDDVVPILPIALDKLKDIYVGNKLTWQMWREQNGSPRESTFLDLIGRLAVDGKPEDIKKKIICSVIKRANFESANTFDQLDILHSSLKVNHKNYRMVTELITKSICVSLKRKGISSPSPNDVSSVLQAEVGVLLANRPGLETLLSFAKTKHSQKGIFKLFGHIYDFFICRHVWTEHQANIDGLVHAISHCISSSTRQFDFAVEAFQVASSWHDIFTNSHGESKLSCLDLGQLIVSGTEIGSSIRCTPSLMYDIPSFELGSSSGGPLIDCLVQELVSELKVQCLNMKDAVSFCMSSKSMPASLTALENVASEIILNSFSKWSPSNIDMLLDMNGSTLVNAHTFLSSLQKGNIIGGKDKVHQARGEKCAHTIRHIILNWLSDYNNDGFDARQIDKVSIVLTEEKRNALIDISGQSFPTNSELEGKVSAIKDTYESIRVLLTICSKTDGTSCSHTILDLARAYRIITDDNSLFSELISKYFSGRELNMSLAELCKDRDKAGSFAQAYGGNLQAAAYFLANKSVLFQRGVGKWLDISIEEFLAHISTTLAHFAALFSPSVKYSTISKVAKILEEEDVCAENELRTVSSFPYLAVDESNSSRHLLNSIRLAMIGPILQNFVDCCKTYKFMFVTSDKDFAALTTVCKRLFGEEGLEMDVSESCQMGLRIADILMPNPAPLDFDQRLDMCRPTLQFFDVLRHCSTVFTMAKERMWFGEEGLQTFYKEWTNVSNVFKSNKSFENEVLDRLEPTIRAVSAVGGALGCCSVASLLEMLKDNENIHKLDEIRLVQANILKVQDWFSEGMDDMAAIFSKFALIQTSGRFVIRSETPMESAVPKRILVLNYFRSQTSNDELVTMAGDDIKEFVQFLGFVNHDSDDAANSATRFIGIYWQLSEIMENQQSMVDVGFNDSFICSTMDYSVQHFEFQSIVAECLDESQHKLTQCNDWLKEVRSIYRYSLLFWMDELRYIFQLMSQLRNVIPQHDMNIQECLQKILDALSRLSPVVSQNSACSDLILEYVNESVPPQSWLEDVSALVNRCGQFAESLRPPCFQAAQPTYHKKMVIHKTNCCEDMMFAAALHLLSHIYKRRCPASFEVFDGACIQAPDELQLFLDRVLAFPDHTFTIISVDELPANEQGIIASFLAKYSRSADKMHLHCIQLRDTMLHAAPGVEIRHWDDSSFGNEHHRVWLQNHVTSERHINNITIVCGPSGSGKTRHIREEIKKLATSKRAEVASLYIHEDFSLSKAVASLMTKFKSGDSQNRAIHFGFSGMKPSKELMFSINNFFNSFLVLQSIYGPSSGSGNCFHCGMHSYDLFIELDCAENESVCQDWLSRHVPILTCCTEIIQPPLDYTIDDKTRRVCTYLRAYDNGTIDRKFDPTPLNKRIMFVLDKSESMEIDLGGRHSLEVAADCMLSIFDSHLQLEDHVGLIRFNHQSEQLIPLQRIEDDVRRSRLRTTMHAARDNPQGSTHMFTALSQAINSLDQNNDVGGDAWIICLTDGQSWDSNRNLRRQLQNSPNNLHIILVGINLDEDINEDMVQLCNKYQPGTNHRNKGFFLPTSANMLAIEEAFSQVASRIPVSQTFELDGMMSEVECRVKLEEHRPQFIDPENKLIYSFWVNFLFRRVSVFDQNDDFNFNEECESLGSSLMEVMLSESEQMLKRDQNCNWTSSNHTQLIYDFSQQDSPQFRLICTSPDNLDRLQREKLNQLDLPGFNIPTTSKPRERQTLDRYLSQALCIPLNEGLNGRKSLQCIDANKFVLTLDFTLKLLNVHERVSCGVPCLMEGETGVSKTALTKMYSILINSQQNSIASASTMGTLRSILCKLTSKFPTLVSDDDEDREITDKIRKFLQPSPHHSAKEGSQMVCDLIYAACTDRNAMFVPIPPKLCDAEDEGVFELLTWFSESYLEPTFFDVNIDPAMTAGDIKHKISEVRRAAQKISSLNVKVVVFFDEINTSSVLGLLKEVIVDHSLNGDLLEENIVVIAACNPVRQSTVSQAKSSREIDLGRDWVSGHYQVKKLPTSLEVMSWNFGSLNSDQEKEFIHQRIIMMDEPIPSTEVRGITEVISSSHKLIRTLATKHITKSLQRGPPSSDNKTEAKLRASSAVSLRDIQRVFHLFNFFLHDFSLALQSPGNFRQAMLLSVGVVYYLRLDKLSRREFLHELKSLPSEQYQDCFLKEVLESAMDTLLKHTEIPAGIALTSGLKENVFMTLVCTLSRTPLMIIGPPGCSKTLAVSIVTDNANGEESPGLFYRKYARVQPFHYQCSKSSTSTEVASVFDRAIQRQSKVNRFKQQCLVFMDEAGLPEEEKESLKVLHYLLEGHMSASPEVGFVCITNHILDAAKSNRCVCLLRPEPDKCELMSIAMGVLCQKHHGDESTIQFICFETQMMTADSFCDIMCGCYLDLIQNKSQFSWFVQFFGLRDFIYLIKHIRRNSSLKDSMLHISVEILLHALERNFNGVNNENFSNICASFLANFTTDKSRIEESLSQFLRHPMAVLQNSLSERLPEDASRYNLPRYKMIIDNTNDDSVMRLLRMSGILNSSHLFYMLSGMSEGSDLEQLNLVSRIKYAAQQGASVVMSQVEEISECFYDLFNQHFKEFKKEGQTSYFANIAIGGISRPCIIHPSFQCIVHVQSNQLDDIPAPFLNRFEKFQLNIDDILSWLMSQLPPGINGILSSVLSKCEDLLFLMGNQSIWSTSPDDTLKSLFISMMPPAVGSPDLSQRGHVAARQTIHSSTLNFLKKWLIADISIEDIEQSILTASSELHGLDGVEFRKILDIESIDQGQLEKAFLDLTLAVQPDSPLSRSLNFIVQATITRHVVFKLLQVTTPEAIFLQRDCLPDDVLRLYFGRHEHFHLKSFISKISNKSNTNSKLHMLHARSDSCAHMLPTWCGHDGCTSKLPDESLSESKIRDIVYSNPSDVEIHHLALLKSESSVRSTIDSWSSKKEVDSFILVVNMQMQCSSNLVNFIRTYTEQIGLMPTKKFFLLLHYPLSCEKPSYPALFLGNWQCAYLDGIGYHGASSSHLSVNNVFTAACFDEDVLDASSLLGALLPKAGQYVASQVSFYSHSPHTESVNKEMQFPERLIKIEAVLKYKIKGETLGQILIEKYLCMWTKEAICEMLHRSARGLKSGTTHLSLSTAVRNTFQHTFNKFLANSILDINVWSNLDMLEEACSNSETDDIFSLVLDALPTIPLKELLLHRDVYHHLNPLPLDLNNSQALVFFPFYYQISSCIDMVLDKAYCRSLENNSQIDQSDIMERADKLFGTLLEDSNNLSLPIDESMIETVRAVIKAVESSPGLFERYLSHMLLWKLGVRNLPQGVAWTLNKINKTSPPTSSWRQNLVFLHIVCKLNDNNIIRISSWDIMADLPVDLSTEGETIEGHQLVSMLLSHFKTSLTDSDMTKWSHSFSVFMQSIPTIIGDEAQIVEKSMVIVLRQLVFLSVIIKVNVPQATLSKMTEQINEVTHPMRYSLSNFFELLNENSASNGMDWIRDAEDALLRIFFSPWWLRSISDIDQADANFLLALIKKRLVEHQMAVVHLRNLLLSSASSDHNTTQFTLPTKLFSRSVAQLTCRNLIGEGISDCCQESMLHYIPPWLRSDSQSATNNDIIDDISWFLQSYTNSFEGPLADATFDIILGVLLDRVKISGSSSEDLLGLLEQTIYHERAVSQMGHMRRQRLLQLDPHAAFSSVGSSLGILEADAILICFVCKVAEELSTTSQALALCGMDPYLAARVLSSIMAAPKWPELFFSVIVRMRGEGHLVTLLSEGGALNSFDWCGPWKQGISLLRRDILAEMTDAETNLRNTQREIAQFNQHYRACPHCRGLFGIDQINCRQFICGRDAHEVGGAPAVGGQAVRGTFGCGRNFSLDQSLPYNQSSQHTEDQTALQRLGEDYETKKIMFDEFNSGSELRMRAIQFKVPPMSFHVQREQADCAFRSIHLVDFMPEVEGNPGTRLLVNIIGHLPKLAHLSYLPDMIEFYVFVHKTFRHMVTKDQAMNTKVENIMDKHLLTNRFGSIDCTHLQSLWTNVVKGVNTFLSENDSVVNWDCEEVHVPFSDITNCSLMSILSEMEHPTEGHDFLFLIINELVLRYNNFIKSLSAIASPNSIDLEVEEIHPRTLLRASRGSIILNGAISHTQVIIDNLIESYWMRDERNFNTESLTKAIINDMGMMSQLQLIKSPLSFLRERFDFRDCSASAENGDDSSAACFCSSDGLFFARNEDLSLYEEVKDGAKKNGFVEGNTNNRHTIIVTFQNFPHDAWTNLLEGLRNVMCYLQRDDFLRGVAQFGQTVMSACGTPSLQEVGFPDLDDAQLNFLNSLGKNELWELICVCGEQLSSEAYRFVGISSVLAEPFQKQTADSAREGILNLLDSKTTDDIINEIDAFCDDVLNFYCERLILPASESSNEGLSAFLKRNNCCDESDGIFAAIPHSVTTRNYIDLQKLLYQTKLKLLFDSRERVPSASAIDEDQQIYKCNDSKWKWLAKTQSQDNKTEEISEKYHWKVFGNLWFQDALLKGSIDIEESIAASIDLEQPIATSEETNDLTESDEMKGDAHNGDCDSGCASITEENDDAAAALPKNNDLTIPEDAVVEPTELQADVPISTQEDREKGAEGIRIEGITTKHQLDSAQNDSHRPSTVRLYILGAILILLGIFFCNGLVPPRIHTQSSEQFVSEVDKGEDTEPTAETYCLVEVDAGNGLGEL